MYRPLLRTSYVNSMDAERPDKSFQNAEIIRRNDLSTLENAGFSIEGFPILAMAAWHADTPKAPLRTNFIQKAKYLMIRLS